MKQLFFGKVASGIVLVYTILVITIFYFMPLATQTQTQSVTNTKLALATAALLLAGGLAFIIAPPVQQQQIVKNNTQLCFNDMLTVSMIGSLANIPVVPTQNANMYFRLSATAGDDIRVANIKFHVATSTVTTTVTMLQRSFERVELNTITGDQNQPYAIGTIAANGDMFLNMIRPLIVPKGSSLEMRFTMRASQNPALGTYRVTFGTSDVTASYVSTNVCSARISGGFSDSFTIRAR